MRKAFKLVTFIIILLIASLLALPLFIDPNEYKQEISDQVEKATGRQLTLEGDISLSVFPWIAIELGPLSLSNADGFTADKFAKVDAAEIRIKLLPLLKQKLEMDTVILDGLVVNLEKNKAGKTNFDDLTQAKSEPAKTKDKKPSKPQDSVSSNPALAGISVAGVRLSNANVVWDDASTNEKVELNNFNLTIDSLTPGKKSALNLGFSIISAKPEAKLFFDLNTDVMVDIEKQLYSMTDLSIKTKAESPLLPEKNADLELSADITADMSAQTLTISDLAIELYDLIIKAKVNAENIQSNNPTFAGSLNVDTFNLRKLAKKLAIELPEMTNDSALEQLQLTTEMSGSSKHIDLQQLVFKLDESTLSGNLGVKNFAKPVVNFALALDTIDVDAYLPPKAEASDTDTTTQAGPVEASSETSPAASNTLPLEPLRAVNAVGTFDIGKLKVSGLHSDTIHLTLNANNGLIKLNPLSANLYQGNYKGNVNLDARTNKLKLSLNEKLANVHTGPLLKDLTGDDILTGAVNATIKLTGNGATVDQIKQTLNGNGEFSFTDGAIKGINIAQSIRKAKALISQKSIPESSEPLKTDFSALSGTFNIVNGLVKNTDLLAMSPLLRVNGAGNVSIPKETIDYGLKVAIVGTSKGQDGKDLSDLKGLTIPLTITGTFSEPKPRVDMKNILKDEAKAKLKAKATEKIKEKLGGDLGGLLGGAIGSDSTDSRPEDGKPKNPLEDKLKSLF